jgi:tRNA A58 N-methylase Trm61
MKAEGGGGRMGEHMLGKASTTKLPSPCGHDSVYMWDTGPAKQTQSWRMMRNTTVVAPKDSQTCVLETQVFYNQIFQGIQDFLAFIPNSVFLIPG